MSTSTLYHYGLTFLALLLNGEPDTTTTEIAGVVRSRQLAPIPQVRLYIINERTRRYISTSEEETLTGADGTFNVRITPTDDPIIVDFQPPLNSGFAPSSLRLLGGELSAQNIRKVLPSSDEVTATQAIRSAPAEGGVQKSGDVVPQSEEAPQEEVPPPSETAEPPTVSQTVSREYSTLLAFEEYYFRAMVDGRIDEVEEYRMDVIKQYLGAVGANIGCMPAETGTAKGAPAPMSINRFDEKLRTVAGLYDVAMPRCAPTTPCVRVCPPPPRCRLFPLFRRR